MSCDTPAPRTATHCGPCSPSERNRYFRDKRLTVADLVLEQEYLVGRRRLINRAMLGWGVVEGFAVAATELGATIGPGLALDRHGRELVACDLVELAAPGDVLWLTEGDCGWTASQAPVDHGDGEEHHRHYLLSAHYAEAAVDGVHVKDDCGSDRCEGNHVCETVVYSLTPFSQCPPGLPDCPCEDGRHAVDEGMVRQAPELPAEAALPAIIPGRELKRVEDAPPSQEPPAKGDPHIAAIHDRGPQEQLVDWSLCRADPHLCAKPHLTRHGHLMIAFDDGVPLACVDVDFVCDKARIVAPIDQHRSRRLAYPNNALFDLIRGCDLTRITDVGWHRWLPHNRRRVPFNDFAAMFIAPTPRSGPKSKKEMRPPVDTKFWVRFSGPVQTRSLTPDVLAITIVQRDSNEDVGTMYRVPVHAIAVAEPTPGDPPDTTRAFRPLVSARFWDGEINPDNSSGFDRDTLVEIEARTAFMVDARGQEVAGGGRYVPTDGCTPGGRFLSSFVVLSSDDDSVDPDDPDRIDPIKLAASPNAEEA